MEENRNNRIKICYDPYEKTIKYWWCSSNKDCWESLTKDSKLSNDRYKSGSLQNLAVDIVKIILEENCSHGMEIDLYFDGTTDDWDDLKRIVDQYDFEQKIHCKEMVSTLRCAGEIVPEIDKIFHQLADEIKATSNDSVETELMRYEDAMRPEVALCVFGTYSSGKSAFINSLIGEEILSSSKGEETARIFRITPLSTGSITDSTIRFQYQKEEITLGFNANGYFFQNAGAVPNIALKQRLDSIIPQNGTVSASYIYQIIQLLNKFDGETDNQTIGDMIEIKVPFIHSALPLDKYNFIIYDTPGSDSAAHQDHFIILQTALESQTNGLPICITTPDGLNKTGAQTLANELRRIGNALDQSNILVVVNQADTGSTSDYEKDAVIKTEVGKMAHERLFFASSIIGLGAKKADMETCGYETTRKVFRNNLDDFSGDGEETTQLYRYNILPSQRYQAICEQADKAKGDIRSRLHHNSGIWAVENEIGVSRTGRKLAYLSRSSRCNDLVIG